MGAAFALYVCAIIGIFEITLVFRPFQAILGQVSLLPIRFHPGQAHCDYWRNASSTQNYECRTR
jgi:hypothetical protein